MNALKGGMAHSDVVVTVSPSHAQELCTAEGGFGLHDRFTGLGDRPVGILNGIDPDLWNPETDPELTGNYSSEDLAGKRRCKAALQRAYGLAQRGHTPLFGVSGGCPDRKSTRLNSSHLVISYAVFCFEKKKKYIREPHLLMSHIASRQRQ